MEHEGQPLSIDGLSVGYGSRQVLNNLRLQIAKGEIFALEKNDFYAVVFAGVAILLFLAGETWWRPLTWIGLGVTIYGFLYFVLHDGLVHQRWPFKYIPRKGYLKRVYQAHRLHHAVKGKDGCVSFGFVYAPPVEKLVRELQENRRNVDETALAGDDERSALH